MTLETSLNLLEDNAFSLLVSVAIRSQQGIFRVKYVLSALDRHSKWSVSDF